LELDDPGEPFGIEYVDVERLALVGAAGEA
jgi:hypothetical protein